MGQPDRDWIQDKLSDLTAHIDELESAGGAVDHPQFGAWTALKLVVLTATVDVYTTIMASNDFRYHYVDAMSGSGLVGLKGRDEILMGSPIIAGTVAHEPFENMYLIENDETRAAALEDRLDYAADNIDAFRQSPDSYEVLVGDANDLLPQVHDRIDEQHDGNPGGDSGERGQHHLAFIDNERNEVSFSAIRQLESFYGDLLINYQETSLNRERGLLESGDSDDWDTFIEFFDGDERALHLEEPERFGLYLEKVESIPRPIHESVNVRGSSSYGYNYRIVYAVRQSGGESEFIEFMDGQRRKVEGLTGDDIDTVLDTMRGSATHLGLWSVDEDGDDDSQADLDRFS